MSKTSESASFFRRFSIRFGLVALYAVVLLAIGTVAYVRVEGWTPGDALYMTAITITAVGYEEVRPLTDQGRYLTMGLLALGITGLGAWFALITSFIVEIDVRNLLRRRRIMKEIDGLSGHLVVCGVGRTGLRVMQELFPSSAEFVVVEHDHQRLETARTIFDTEFLSVEGDATHDAVLVRAGIERAAGLVSALSRDEDNVYVCLSARALNPALTIVARAYEEESTSKLYRAGANHVVSPNVTGAVRMAAVLLRPSVVSFLDVAIRAPDVSLRLEQSTVGKGSDIAGKRLRDARIREETGLMVIALRKKEAAGTGFIFNPEADTLIEAGDDLIVLGKHDQIERLRTYAVG